MGVKPFDSAALRRLIERVVDSGFMVKEKMKHHFCITLTRMGVPFSPNHQTLFRKNVPRSLIASRK